MYRLQGADSKFCMVLGFLEGLFFFGAVYIWVFVNFALRGWRLKVTLKQIMVWKRE